jgi:hypothetical protein
MKQFIYYKTVLLSQGILKQMSESEEQDAEILFAFQPAWMSLPAK